jgi:hypothetical protein
MSTIQANMPIVCCVAFMYTTNITIAAKKLCTNKAMSKLVLKCQLWTVHKLKRSQRHARSYAIYGVGQRRASSLAVYLASVLLIYSIC